MLTVVTGPMFSSKTTTLIGKCISNVIAGQDVLVFSPSLDNRYDTKNLVTHDGRKFPCIRVGTKNKKEIISYIDKYNGELSNLKVIAFDESQFFDRDIFIELINDLLRHKYEVICAGLSQDSSGLPFGAMDRLLSMADSIVHLKAVCSSCKGINKATRTYRKTCDTSQISVGGVESYEARCFECWTGK